MKINPSIFKAYDIRGVYNKDFDDNLAYKLGLAYANLIKKETKKEEINIIVGLDMRVSSPNLKKSLLDGLTDGGCNVSDIELASTPTFYFSVARYNHDGGILVSASHNPAEYNGFKMVRKKSVPFSGDSGIMDLRDAVLNNNLKKSKKRGAIKKKSGTLEILVKESLKHVNIKKIKKFKIVIDPANSMGSLYFEELFKYLNCDIVKMNWELDGTFPNHEADPLKPENVKDLSKKIREENADFGITTDGDGDRISFVDNKGIQVEGGIMRAILSKLFLKEKPGSKIAYDVRPGKISKDTIEKNNGIPIVTRVGHSLIKEQMLKEDIYFAGESSGHFYLNFGEDGCFESPVIITLKILEELSKQNVSLSEYTEEYKIYSHSGEINNKVKNPKEKIEEIKEAYKDGKQNYIDGISVEYDNFWFNVRGSNTEPVLRLNLEAVDKKTMEEKKDEVLKIITS